MPTAGTFCLSHITRFRGMLLFFEHRFRVQGLKFGAEIGQALDTAV